MDELRLNIIEQITQEIFNTKEIVIAGHVHPDGDAVASCLALAMSLSKLGKNVKVLLEDYPLKYNFISGKEFLYKGDYAVLEPALFIACDCGGIERLGDARPVFEKARKTIVIDHHLSNQGFGDLNFVMTYASSACEMVYDIVALIGNVDAEIASAIYAGVIFDTGGFRFGSTSAETMRKIATLLQYDIPFTEIYTETMFTHTVEEAMLFSHVISKMKYIEETSIVYSNISRKEMEHYNGTSNDLDGIVEYLLNTKGAKVAVFVYESNPGLSKVSLRSKGSIDVNAIAGNWGGGGHKNASGCSIEGDVDSILDVVIEYIAKRLGS